MKYRLMAFLILAESKLKSWIIKYGRRESVELMLQNYLVSLQNQDTQPPRIRFLVGNWVNIDCHCGSELFTSSLFLSLSFSLSLAQSFIEGQQFFEKYETLFQTLKCSAELYVKADCTG